MIVALPSGGSGSNSGAINPVTGAPGAASLKESQVYQVAQLMNARKRCTW